MHITLASKPGVSTSAQWSHDWALFSILVSLGGKMHFLRVFENDAAKRIPKMDYKCLFAIKRLRP